MKFEVDKRRVYMTLETNKQKELLSLCNKVADFLDENFSPYTSVVIDANTFIVKEDIMDGYFDIKVKEKE